MAPFVGRLRELTLLRDQLDEARGGHPRLVLIEGPPGIGKTSLVNSLLFERPEVQLIRASGEESEALLAYGVIDQLLRFAAASGAHREAPTLPSVDHLKVGAELLELIGNLQEEEERPVVIVVDDLHWADQPSQKALLFALRRQLADRVLVLFVARREELHRLPEGLIHFINSGGGITLQLDGLEASDLQELAELKGVRPFSIRAAQHLQHHTLGNPLHARALLDEVQADAWSNPELSLPAPRSFGRLVLGRLGRLPDEAQRLVMAASVLGRRSLLDTAANLARVSDSLQALEEAQRADLLQEAVTPSGMVEFPHPLIRAAVYHDLGAADRAALHLRAASLVEDQASALQHRVAAAVRADSRLAAELADFARGETGRGAWASAAARLLSASRLSPRAERERLLLEAVNWMLFSGNLTEAGEYSEEIARFVPSARRDSVLGQLALQRGLPREAGPLLQSAWQLCDASAEPEFAASVALQNAVHMLAQIRGAEGAEWARRALELSATPGNPIAYRGLGLLSLTLAYAGQPAQARAALDSIRLPGEVGANDWALLIRGLLAMVEDDLPGALSDLGLAARTALQRGLLQGAASAFGWLATAEYYSGAWDDALRHAERAVLVNTESERQYRAFVASAVVAVPAARGDWSLADEHALMVARQFPGYESSIATAAMAGAELATARLDHQGVLDALQPVLGFPHREGIDEPGFWPWQDLYADALVSLDRVSEADAFLRPHESRAAERGRRSMMARLARVRGRIEAAKGLPEEAEAAFLSGLQHIQGLQMPFEQARIQLAYGSFLRRLGSRRAAAVQLRLAQASLIELGAEPYLARCDGELAACGLTPRKRRDRGRIGLTPREVNVARLVGSGLTNREVAGELFLSTKTIEFHLSQIFDKLGITSRRQIAEHPQLAGGT
jgi:DNA-binding CsgD family transcriptional regulator